MSVPILQQDHLKQRIKQVCYWAPNQTSILLNTEPVWTQIKIEMKIFFADLLVDLMAF